MKTFAVLDTDATGRLVEHDHQKLIEEIHGHAYMPSKVQEQLGNWQGPLAHKVKEFANNLPDYITVMDPQVLDQNVAAHVQNEQLHEGEAQAISLAKELSSDGSRGVVLSDDGGVRKFLNFEQNPEIALRNQRDEFFTAGIRADIAKPGPDTPHNRLAATEDQQIFAETSLSTVCQGAERGLVAQKQLQDFTDSIARKPATRELVGQFQGYLSDQQRCQDHAQQKSQDNSHEQ